MALSPMLKSLILTPFNILHQVNPELNAKLLYRIKTGESLHLDDPKSYNEKIQWIKLYDRNPLMPQCVDKYTVRDYVISKGLGHILNHLYWEGFNPSDIPFDLLPNQFVIKVTHGSGFNILCNDKATLDRPKTIAKLNRWLKENYIPCYGEWFYGIVRPRIIVEELLVDTLSKSAPYDYKVFCFNGIPRFISVDTGRYTNNHRKDIYDTRWNLLKGYELSYPSSGIALPRPAPLEQMLDYAHILSGDFSHARIDFFVIGDKLFFGEITFCHGSGYDLIHPKSFAYEMGSYLKLPINKR